MAKTYVPGAVLAAKATHKYLTRYQTTLSSAASSDQILALVDLISCLATFLSKWHKPSIQP